jgi:hypothetical protein
MRVTISPYGDARTHDASATSDLLAVHQLPKPTLVVMKDLAMDQRTGDPGVGGDQVRWQSQRLYAPRAWMSALDDHEGELCWYQEWWARWYPESLHHKERKQFDDKEEEMDQANEANEAQNRGMATTVKEKVAPEERRGE